MWDELSDGDLLRHLVVQVLAVEDHGLQDGEGALQHGRVHGRLVDVAGDLQEQSGRGETVWRERERDHRNLGGGGGGHFTFKCGDIKGDLE